MPDMRDASERPDLQSELPFAGAAGSVFEGGKASILCLPDVRECGVGEAGGVSALWHAIGGESPGAAS